MWLDEQALTHPTLAFDPPLINAAGMLGFAPNAHLHPFLKQLGAFVTNPVSYAARTPAHNRCCLQFAGGILLHGGLPNPGFRRVFRRCARLWQSSPVPVIVHLLWEANNNLAVMVRALEGVENILAIELGFPANIKGADVQAAVQQAQGELPIIPVLSVEQIFTMLDVLPVLPIAGVRLAEMRGSLPDASGKLVQGRLYGSAYFAQTCQAVHRLAGINLPLIAGGGVMQPGQVATLLAAGAKAVALDIALWQPDCFLIGS